MKKFIIPFLIVVLGVIGCSNNTDNAEVTFYLVADPQSNLADLPAETIEVEGCGLEYLVPHTVEYEDNEDNLANALNALFQNNYATYPDTNLMDTTYMSSLLAFYDEERATGRITVDLEGTLMYAGHCDSPRFKSQVEKTIELYFPGAEYEVRVNGDAKEWRCLGDESGLCE